MEGYRISNILHCKAVETAVNNGNSAGDKLCGVGHQIVDGAAEFLGLAHTTEGSLTYHILSALGEGAVGIGEQAAVLLGDEEARGNGVHSDALAEFLGALGGHEGGEIADASLGCGISAHAGHRTEGCHRREVDDRALALIYHWAEEHLCGDDSAGEVEVEHSLKLLGLEVEEGLLGGDGGTLHIASGGIQESVDTSVFLNDVVAVLLHHLLIHHVGLQKFTLATSLLDVGYNLGAHIFLATEDYHFGSIEGQILCNGAAQYSGAARDGYHVALDIK